MGWHHHRNWHEGIVVTGGAEGAGRSARIAGLVLSKEPAAVNLVELLLAKAPSILVPPAIVAAAKPDHTATALKLLAEYPSVALDEASVAPLLAKDGERLKKLVLDESCAPLMAALCAKSDVIKAAMTSHEMIAAFATPEAASVALTLIETFGIEINEETSKT